MGGVGTLAILPVPHPGIASAPSLVPGPGRGAARLHVTSGAWNARTNLAGVVQGPEIPGKFCSNLQKLSTSLLCFLRCVI